jgi:hypothetical protein
VVDKVLDELEFITAHPGEEYEGEDVDVGKERSAKELKRILEAHMRKATDDIAVEHNRLMLTHFKGLKSRLQVVEANLKKIDIKWTNWSGMLVTLPESTLGQYLDAILSGHGLLLLQLLSYMAQGCLRAGLEQAFISECEATPVKGVEIGKWCVGRDYSTV